MDGVKWNVGVTQIPLWFSAVRTVKADRRRLRRTPWRIQRRAQILSARALPGRYTGPIKD
jgi:heme exporter protein D